MLLIIFSTLRLYLTSVNQTFTNSDFFYPKTIGATRRLRLYILYVYPYIHGIIPREKHSSCAETYLYQLRVRNHQ